MSLKFFIDECLTAALVAAAKERELFAIYGPYAGMAGWQDWSIAEFALDNDLIVVTNNRRDFLKEYAGMDIHPGLVVIVPKGNRPDQVQWFSMVLDFLLGLGEPPVNKLIEIHVDGRITMQDWSRSP